MPSAPSPQFPGLAASPLQHNSDEGFSFMHESEVDRSKIPYSLIIKHMFISPQDVNEHLQANYA